jgi:hypothetical protein
LYCCYQRIKSHFQFEINGNKIKINMAVEPVDGWNTGLNEHGTSFLVRVNGYTADGGEAEVL